jgi:vancomycin permeability regulator SanA
LDVAADLCRRGKVEVLLASGDNSTAAYDEPSAMRAHLMAHAVPGEVVVAAYTGLDTGGSGARAHRVFKAFGVGHDTSGTFHGATR